MLQKYGKQYLINRMLDYNMLYVEESFVTAISENPPETAADFEARVQRAIEADCIQGLRIAEGQVTICTPFVEDEPTRWTAYADLLKGSSGAQVCEDDSIQLGGLSITAKDSKCIMDKTLDTAFDEQRKAFSTTYHLGE